MLGRRLRSNGKSVVAILCAACFLAASVGSVTRAAAADTFETWPKKKTEPGVAPAPSTDANGASKAGGVAGKNVEKGLSNGMIGMMAAGAAVIIGVAIAAGGGGTTSNH